MIENSGLRATSAPLRVLLLSAFLFVLLALPTVLSAQVRRSDFYLAMDDSVLLDVALFEPTKTAPDSGFPAVVFVHGLGGDKEDMADAAQLFVALDGYVALSYSVRGQGNSGGLRTFSGERERQDLRTILEWLASRPNVNGRRIGIVGGSQGGQHAWWAALYGMPVRAVAAAAGYLGDLTSNGCIEVGVLGVLSSSHVRYGPVWQQVLNWVLDDAYDSLKAVLPQPDSLISRVRVPFFFSLAYKDKLFAVNEGLRQFDLLQCPKRLQLGTGYHGAEESDRFNNTLILLVTDWFRRWLGSDRGFDPRQDSLVVYHTDGDWAPHYAGSFPPREARWISFYLQPGGGLSPVRPDSRSRVVIGQRLLDPTFTARAALAEGFQAGTVAKFARQTAEFVSQPFGTDVTWVGAPMCTLAVNWSGPKMQLHVQFYDVGPDGSWHFLQRGNVAVREEDGGRVLSFAAQAYAHVFPAGHRLGVRLVPIDYVETEKRCYAIPFFESFADTVFLGGEEPARIALPLIGFRPSRVAATSPAVPLGFEVSPAWPNPFIRETRLRVSLNSVKPVRVRVLDVLGRTVRVLSDGKRLMGTQAFRWDGRDEHDEPVPAGVYLLTVEAGTKRVIRKICLTR